MWMVERKGLVRGTLGEKRAGSGRDRGQGVSGNGSQLPGRVGLPAKEAQRPGTSPFSTTSRVPFPVPTPRPSTSTLHT